MCIARLSLEYTEADLIEEPRKCSRVLHTFSKILDRCILSYIYMTLCIMYVYVRVCVYVLVGGVIEESLFTVGYRARSRLLA